MPTTIQIIARIWRTMNLGAAKSTILGLLGMIVVQKTLAEESLVYVTAVWRHGDRAPNELPYPNDKYDQSYWPRGWAQLTNVSFPLNFSSVLNHD